MKKGSMGIITFVLLLRVAQFVYEEYRLDPENAIQVTSEKGIVTVDRLHDGEYVKMLSTDGEVLDATRASGTTARFKAKQGEVVVIKVGNEKIKAKVK